MATIFGDKIDYNAAHAKDNCALFAPTPLFSGPGYPMVSLKFLRCRPLLLWQPTGLIQRQNFLQLSMYQHVSDIVTSRIIFFLHQLPSPVREYSENSE